MRELARIQFRGDATEFVDTWNSLSDEKIEVRVIALYKDDPTYRHMRRLFESIALRRNMMWVEHIRVEYSDNELRSFDLLSVNVTGRACEVDRSRGDIYRTEPECLVCGRNRYIQIRNVILNIDSDEDEDFDLGCLQHDICETDSGEIVVSDRFKRVLDDLNAPSIDVLPVEIVPNGVSVKSKYHQLVVKSEIGPLIYPTRIQRLDLCEACGQYKQVLLGALPGTQESEFHFPKSAHTGQQLTNTQDRFGRVPHFNPHLIMSPILYQCLIENGVTGFWVQPAHLVS